MIDHDTVDEWREKVRKEEVERLRRARIILRDNPSLTQGQAEQWERQQRAPTRLPPKCCPCQRCSRVEVVATGDYLGLCKCDCHEELP